MMLRKEEVSMEYSSVIGFLQTMNNQQEASQKYKYDSIIIIRGALMHLQALISLILDDLQPADI